MVVIVLEDNNSTCSKKSQVAILSKHFGAGIGYSRKKKKTIRKQSCEMVTLIISSCEYEYNRVS